MHLLSCLSLCRPSIPDREFDIRDFGAVEGGTVKNTQAIRQAISAAAKAGGGHVVIPAGKWLTGAIHLDNNIDLHLLRDAELLFSQDAADYLPVVFSRHEDIECYKYSAFIYADQKTNIADHRRRHAQWPGQALVGMEGVQARREKDLLCNGGQRGPGRASGSSTDKEGRELRPAFFQPMHCTNVLVEGVTFLYGAFWTITPTYCENVIVRNVHIGPRATYGHTPNGDGIDPSSCKNVLIEHCTFDTGDDCIAIKAGRDADGLRVAQPDGECGRPTLSRAAGARRHCDRQRDLGRHQECLRLSTVGSMAPTGSSGSRPRAGAEAFWRTCGSDNLAADTIEQEALHINMLYTGSGFLPCRSPRRHPLIRNIHYSNITCTLRKGAR